MKKKSVVKKGVAALYRLNAANSKSGFFLAAGDDQSDEDLIGVMPFGAASIKVDPDPSYAKFNLNNSDEVVSLLNAFCKSID